MLNCDIFVEKKFPGQISSGFRFCLKFSGFVHFSNSIIQLLSKQCLVMITHVQDVPRTSGSGFCFDTNPVSYKPQFWSLHDLRNFLVKIIFSPVKICPTSGFTPIDIQNLIAGKFSNFNWSLHIIILICSEVIVLKRIFRLVTLIEGFFAKVPNI